MNSIDREVTDASAKFSPGQLIRHKRFGYRGVVVDVDATFQLGDDWYEEVARSRPPKDQPWYHVLVDQSETTTYVAQRHLEIEDSPEPIRHPMLNQFFSSFRRGRYELDSQIN
jgi:heat shock protein HspQ